MNTVSKAAQLLGRASKGVPRNFTQAERKRRAARLAAVRSRRWVKRSEDKAVRSKG